MMKYINLFSSWQMSYYNRKLDDLSTGLYLFIFNAGCLEVKDQDVLQLGFWMVGLHILQISQRIRNFISYTNNINHQKFGHLQAFTNIFTKILTFSSEDNFSQQIVSYKYKQIKPLLLTKMQQNTQKHPVQRHIQALDDAYKVHNDLLNTINQMDTKIQQVIRCHQAQFLIAYRNHIKNMKQQLNQIKNRTQEQQKKMMSNQRSVFLQKQIILFRQQAIRLYDRLQQKMQQNQSIKSSIKQLQKCNALLQKQNRQQLRQIRILQTQKSMVEGQIQVLSNQKQTLVTQLDTIKQKARASHGVTTNTHTAALLHKYGTPKQDDSYMPIPINSRTGKRRTQPKLRQTYSSKMKTIQQRKRMSIDVLDHQIKNCFVDCLQTIRREVGQRKVYGAKSDDINSIGSWQEFRMIDKLRLLQMFMQNQKLLVWMYQKIFPTRLNEIQSYFQVKTTNNSNFDPRAKSKSMNINLDEMTLEDIATAQQKKKMPNSSAGEDSALLPKVQLSSKRKKQKKYDVRSRIQMKNGKLNLSQMNSEYQ